MHRPPAVSYNVVRSRWHFFAILLAIAIAGSAGLAFAAQQRPDWRIGLLALGFFLASTLALRAWSVAPVGRLHWDGESWHGPGVGQALVRLQIALDFQFVVLVHITCQQGAAGWLWLDRSTDATAWTRLRRALVASSHQAPHDPDAAADRTGGAV